MKEQKYNIELEDYRAFYRYLRKQHNGILGAVYDDEKGTLIICYEDSATELTQEQLKNMKLPTILKFRKSLPTTDIPNAKFTSENEFIVETFDVKATRRNVKEKHPHFKEVK